MSEYKSFSEYWDSTGITNPVPIMALALKEIAWKAFIAGRSDPYKALEAAREALTVLTDGTDATPFYVAQEIGRKALRQIDEVLK